MIKFFKKGIDPLHIKNGSADTSQAPADRPEKPADSNRNTQFDARTDAERVADEAGARFRALNPQTDQPKEIGGPRGLEPTRYGDWEKAGRCFDF